MNRRRLLVGAMGVAAAGAFLLPGSQTRRRVERIKPIIEPPPYRFPKDFLWGTATAAAQIERRVPSDWGRFEELVERDQLTRSDGPGRVVPGNIAGYLDYPPSIRFRKTDAEAHYDEDFTAAVAQGHNAYRFSLSWSRLFPHADSKTPNPEAVTTYDGLFASLESAGLDPMVTLFHFESPAWLWEEKEGQRGWEREDAVEHFDHFVKYVVQRWGRKVRRWTTLNEPMVYAYNGYLQGLFPPFEKRSGPAALGKVLENLLRAHVRAYKRIHASAREHGLRVEVGVAAHTRSFLPYRDRAPLDRVVAEQVEQAFIWDFLDALDTGHLRLTNTELHRIIPDLAGSQDYVGINYYGRYYLKSDLFHPTEFQLLASDPDDPLEQVSDLGWAIDP
ncbi:MAG TPA: family 1 glycosylhydrolase, partial [Myxococcota bacterium]|nr:family 1 glycosylhydrolase [Myxococcota bacterium]